MAIRILPSALMSEGKTLGALTHDIRLIDHFDGLFVDPADAASPWNNIETGVGDGPAATANERGGVVAVLPDSADDAVGGLAWDRNWAPEQQGARMFVECKFKVNTTIAATYAFVGWNDESTGAERPIILAASAAYGTVVAGDHAGILFHTLGHATRVYLVATLAGANVGVPIQIANITMAADAWFSFRCEIDALGWVYGAAVKIDAASGGENDPDVGETRIELGVTPTVNMCPYVVFGDLAAGAPTHEIDYIAFGGTVFATAA